MVKIHFTESQSIGGLATVTANYTSKASANLYGLNLKLQFLICKKFSILRSTPNVCSVCFSLYDFIKNERKNDRTFYALYGLTQLVGY